MPVTDNYSVLIGKLDEFIRKYYKNRLIRGGIFAVGLFVVFFLIATLSEYFGRFNSTSRAVLFYIYLLLNLGILWQLLLVPLFRLMRFGKVISHEQAAAIIGEHFPEVSDKLLNVLQLKSLEQQSPDLSAELIRAGINQKIDKLRPVPFSLAINLKQNLKYLRYALPPVIILLLILIISPRVVTEPSQRLVKYQTTYVPPAPFSLSILNDKLEAVQQEDFLLEVKAEGEELPAELYIEVNGVKYRMDRKTPVNFQYRFRNVQDDKHFFLTNDIFKSEEYDLKVLPKPIVLSFDVNLDYPAYTGKTDEKLENTGDLIVPEGTKITWEFYTRDTRDILFFWENEMKEIPAGSSNSFTHSEKAMASKLYTVISTNEYMRNEDSLSYSVSVIPDNYPAITVEQVRDSIFDKKIYFRGLIRDDYGFSMLTFVYQFDNLDKTVEQKPSEVIAQLPVSKLSNQQQFFHFFDLDSIGIEPGEQIVYHFEIWDNDGVNGPKVTRSQPMLFKAPTLDEIEEKTDQENEKIIDDMEQSIKDVQELQKKADDLNRKLLEKENIGWQEKQQIQELLDEQKKLQERIENIQKENEIKSLQEQQYKNMDEELVRKQKKLEELFNEVMTEDMKKLFEEMQQLLDKMDKDKVNEELEKMKQNNEDLEKQLDRNLELFKQLEFEKKLQESIDRLNDLAKQQEELAKQSEQKNADADQLKEKQEELNKEFEKVRQELDDLQKKNSELEEPNKLENTDQQEQEIQQDMQEGTEQLQQNKPSKASSSQKSASEKMKSLSAQLSEMQGAMYSENLEENIETLREILENLVQLSFDQEALISRTKETSIIDPQYPKVIEDQNRIKDDLVMVEDSLWALSKRQQMIEPIITRKIEDINTQTGKALDNLEDRKSGPAGEAQQYVMTNINDLALLLSEVLDQMMSTMQMQCSGQCQKGSPKPGQGKASMKSMKEMQQQLNQQIKQMKEGQKDGKMPQKDARNSASNSESYARMAAQQEAIRRMMEQYQEDMKEQGMGNSKELKEMEEMMEKNENDLVNKMITQQTIDRLNEIEVRLLKHEKAELQREQEEKRESKEGKDVNNRNPEDFLEYNKIKTRETELLRTVPPNLSPFYRTKVNQYFYYFERQ
jgi:hypothetical protein